MKKKKPNHDNDMDCQTCGRKNIERACIVFGKATDEVPFSMNGGKGMICLTCQRHMEEMIAKGYRP